MENIQEIDTQTIKVGDDPITPVVWTLTDSRGISWNIKPINSQPGMFSVAMANPPASSPYKKEVKADAIVVKKEEEESATPGHVVGCPCSKCFIAKKASKGVIVQAITKLSASPRSAVKSTLTDNSLWWVNATVPIYWKHISTRNVHAYGNYCYNDSPIQIWDTIYQNNMFWSFTPVPNQPGYYFINNWMSDQRYCAQQMGGLARTDQAYQRVSMWERNAIVDLLPWLWVKIYPSLVQVYGTGFYFMQFQHNGELILSDQTEGYNFWPINGTNIYAYPYINGDDPCWYFYFEQAIPN